MGFDGPKSDKNGRNKRFKTWKCNKIQFPETLILQLGINFAGKNELEGIEVEKILKNLEFFPNFDF